MEGSLDILILTAGFGTGHLSASLGMKVQIQKIDPSINIDVVDIFQVLIPNLSKAMYKGYDVLVRKSPKLYNYFYYRKNKKPKARHKSYSNQYILKKLNNYILRRNPKLIISTFPVVSQYVSKVRDIYGISIPFITCMTDIVNGWEWIAPNCDRYFVATQDVKKKMVGMGIEKEKVTVTGIPLREEFLCSPKPLVTPALPEGHMILMVMGGGMGLIPDDEAFYHWINDLHKITTIVLTGKNHNLFKLISGLDLKNVIPLKYTEKVADLMAQSDLLVTKAGGITVFEAIASELPLIIYKPELGQEIENARFIRKKSIGNIAFSMKELQGMITDLANNRYKIIEYKTETSRLRYNINMKVLAEESIQLLNNF